MECQVVKVADYSQTDGMLTVDERLNALLTGSPRKMIVFYPVRDNGKPRVTLTKKWELQQAGYDVYDWTPNGLKLVPPIPKWMTWFG